MTRIHAHIFRSGLHKRKFNEGVFAFSILLGVQLYVLPALRTPQTRDEPLSIRTRNPIERLFGAGAKQKFLFGGGGLQLH